MLIYLNTLGDRENSEIQKFYTDLLVEELYTYLLILDETIYLSRSKYHVPYELTIEFLKANVLPFSTVMPIDESDFSLMERYLSSYKIKPSDAIHLSAMQKEGVTNIVSEDGQFDNVEEVKRIWVSKSETSTKKIKERGT